MKLFSPLLLLALFAGGAGAAQTKVSSRLLSIAGDWNTGHGVFYVEQEGERLFGTYDYQGKRDNQFEGKLEADRLRFRWKQPSFPPPQDSGTAEVRLLGNGTRWVGDWFDAKGSRVGSFKGTKIGATPEEPERERALIRPSAVPLEDFSHRTMDGRLIRLSEFVRGKPLVLVSFVTAWCKNCNWEQPFVRRLYDRYHARGLDVLLVSHYAHPHDVGKFVERHKPPFPLAIASTTTDDSTRMGTLHYRFRTANSDLRKWGTPFNVFITNGDLGRPYIAAGELIEADATAFVSKQLRQATSVSAGVSTPGKR